MICMFAVLCYPLYLTGVSGADGLVSVIEGDSITLKPRVADIQKNMLSYKFGAEGALIALRDGNHSSVNYDVSERFKGRLHLDQTGALTISDSKTTDSGLYELNIIGGREDQVKTFWVTIYPRLPAPAIIRNCPQYSSSSISEHSEVSRCVLLCSVLNVEYQDKNTYSCVVNNTISNQTTHLDINTLCQPCDESLCCGSVEGVMRLVISALVGMAAAAFVVEDIRSRKGEQDSREETRC
ncbi:uncharacterized protein LOC130215498 isoform X2 [Danio aesculapii]|uniref:uncharacterized protein LOC130215498 isoform X2 n=1 Tax=Danio aesculapii TaxID=1142201 RepID=UPI0024BFB5B9|nr:uncharacterized protein LOC130215498 isoform X2 [Danio aesculapii]